MMNGLLMHVRANPLVGTSRLLRSLALARQWIGQGGKVIFVTGQLPAILLRQIAISGCEIIRDDSPVGDLAFSRKLCRAAETSGCQWIVIDGTSNDLVRNTVSSKLPGQRLLVLGNVPEGHPVEIDLATCDKPEFALVRGNLGKSAPPRLANRNQPKRCLIDLSRMNGANSAKFIRQICKQFSSSSVVFDFVTPFASSAADQLYKQDAEIRNRLFWHLNPDRAFASLYSFDLAVMTEAASFFESAFCGTASLFLNQVGSPNPGLLQDITTRPWAVACDDDDWSRTACQSIMDFLSSPTRLALHASEMPRLADDQGAARLSATMLAQLQSGYVGQSRSA